MFCVTIVFSKLSKEADVWNQKQMGIWPMTKNKLLLEKSQYIIGIFTLSEDFCL